MQRDAYQEFMALFTKHQSAPTDGFTEGMTAKLEREKADAAAARNDAVGLFGKLALAFGSTDFAGQASQNFEMVSMVRRDPLLATVVSTLFAGKYLERMLDAIRATEKQLGLPAPALVPEPLLPHDDYIKELKRLHLGDVAERYGLDRKHAEELVAKAYAEKAAKQKPTS